jgi:hypothetical protein
VPHDSSDYAERDGEKNHHGLTIGSEHGGNNDENPDDGQRKSNIETAEGLTHFLLFALNGDLRHMPVKNITHLTGYRKQ